MSFILKYLGYYLQVLEHLKINIQSTLKIDGEKYSPWEGPYAINYTYICLNYVIVFYWRSTVNISINLWNLKTIRR